MGDVLELALGTGIFGATVTEYDVENKQAVIQVHDVIAGRPTLMNGNTKAFFGITSINGKTISQDYFETPTGLSYTGGPISFQDIPLTQVTTMTAWVFETSGANNLKKLNMAANNCCFDNSLFEVTIQGIKVYIGFDEYDIKAIQLGGHTFISQHYSGSTALIYMGGGEFDDMLSLRVPGASSARNLSRLDFNSFSKTVSIPGRPTWSNVVIYSLGEIIYELESMLNNLISIGRGTISLTTTGGTFGFNWIVKQS